jgi:hypothetical protein
MGLAAQGQALLASDRAAEAVAPLSQGAAVYHDLQLAGDEYGCLRALAQALVALKRHERALAAISRALELAALVGDKNGRAALLEQRAQCEEATGDHAAAAKTRAEAAGSAKGG